MTDSLEDLVKVVDELDPNVLTAKDIAEIKAWGADRAGFVLVDIDAKKIVYATPGAERIFGYVTNEMTDLPLRELVPKEYQDTHDGYVEGFGQALQDRSMGKRDMVLYGKERDGETFPAEISLFSLKFKKRKLCLANVVRLSKEI